MYLALAGLALAWAAMLLFGGMEFDRGLLLVAYGGRDSGVTEAALWLTELGDFPVLIAATAAGVAFLLWRRDWRIALLLVAVTLSGRLLVALQKEWTARLRPEANEPLVAVQSLAFPSGHAANATLVWLALALLLPMPDRARAFAIWGAVWLALLIGLSRVVLGVHWPSDVIAGWSFGLFWLLAMLRLAGHDAAEGTAPAPAH